MTKRHIIAAIGQNSCKAQVRAAGPPACGGRRSFAAEPSFGRLACGPNLRLTKAQSRSCWRMDWRMRFSRRETCTCVIPRRRATSVWVFLR